MYFDRIGADAQLERNFFVAGPSPPGAKFPSRVRLKGVRFASFKLYPRWKEVIHSNHFF
jgi:hypothetical protein